MQPTVRRLRPLDLGDMLDEAFALYRQNFALFAGIAAVLIVPESIITGIIGLARPSGSVTTTSPGGVSTFHGDVFAGTATVSGVSGLVGLVFGTILTGTLSWAISQRYLGRDVTIQQAYASLGVKTFFLLLFGSLLYVVAILIGLLGLFFGAIFAAVRYVFVSQVIVLERKGVFASFGRSWQLTKRSFWRVFIYGLVDIIIVSLVEGIIGGIAIGIISLGVHSQVVSSVVGALIGIVVQPFQLGFLVLFYYDMRIRKEGFDLEQMASTMEAGRALGSQSEPPLQPL